MYSKMLISVEENRDISDKKKKGLAKMSEKLSDLRKAFCIAGLKFS